MPGRAGPWFGGLVHALSDGVELLSVRRVFLQQVFKFHTGPSLTFLGSGGASVFAAVWAFSGCEYEKMGPLRVFRHLLFTGILLGVLSGVS